MVRRAGLILWVLFADAIDLSRSGNNGSGDPTYLDADAGTCLLGDACRAKGPFINVVVGGKLQTLMKLPEPFMTDYSVSACVSRSQELLSASHATLMARSRVPHSLKGVLLHGVYLFSSRALTAKLTQLYRRSGLKAGGIATYLRQDLSRCLTSTQCTGSGSFTPVTSKILQSFTL